MNTMRVPAKPKRYGRYSGYTTEWKKAIVTLAPDSKPLEFLNRLNKNFLSKEGKFSAY